MKIAFLQDDFPPASFGGAGIIAYRLAQGYKNLGHEIFVITVTDKKDDEGVSEHNGLKIHKIYSDYNLNWRFYFGIYNNRVIGRLKKILSDEKPDIVHAHNILQHISIYSLKVAKQSGAKVFMTAHDCMLFHYGKLNEFIDPDNPLEWKKDYRVTVWQQFRKYKKAFVPFRRTIIKHYLKYANKIFSVSNALKNALVQNGIKNVEVIHNGIDTSEWDEDQQEVEKLKSKFNLYNKKIILFGGRLSAAKGGTVIVKAMKAVNEEIDNAVLLVLGKKDKFAVKMQELAKEYGIANNILFAGWVSGNELKAAYWSADVVATPSLYLDPFPTVNLEAMACGKPVVGTCFGGTPEIVKDKITGYIVNPFDYEKLSEKIIKILNDDVFREKHGQAGRELMKVGFTLDKQVDRYLDYFK